MTKFEERETMDGRSVRIYRTDAGTQFPIHGAICLGPDEWELAQWTKDGLYDPTLSPESEQGSNLKLKTVTVERWANVYESGLCTVHDKKIIAERSARDIFQGLVAAAVKLTGTYDA